VRLHAEQPRVLRRSLAEVDELPTTRDLGAYRARQMVEGGLDSGGDDASAGRREPVLEHLTARVVAKEPEERRPVELGQSLTQRYQRVIDIRRNAQRVRERREIACGHEGEGTAPLARALGGQC
jgi:hypothetical protein